MTTAALREKKLASRDYLFPEASASQPELHPCAAITAQYLQTNPMRIHRMRQIKRLAKDRELSGMAK